MSGILNYIGIIPKPLSFLGCKYLAFDTGRQTTASGVEGFGCVRYMI